MTAMSGAPLSPRLPAAAHAVVILRADRGAGLALRGVALNLFFAAAKFAGGVLGRSHALIADGVESLLDSVSSVLVWGGFRIAARPPDANHPYGHGKAEPLAVLAAALFIFGAALWIAVHSVREIVTPHHTPHWATLVLLVIVVAAKEMFSRRLLLAGREMDSSALRAEAWHHRSDALTSAAAFVGIAVALIGGKGYESADDWAALAACAIIAYNGYHIAGQALNEVMDTAVPREFENQVRIVAREAEGVRAVEKCRVLKSGLGYLVDIHVHVDGGLTVFRGHEIAHAVKNALMRAPLAITDVAVHIEPAQERSPEKPGPQP